MTYATECMAIIGNVTSNLTVPELVDWIQCPYNGWDKNSGMAVGNFTGMNIFFTLIAFGVLGMIYTKTQSLGFTSIVALIAGSSLIFIFPLTIARIGMGLVLAGLAGIAVTILK